MAERGATHHEAQADYDMTGSARPGTAFAMVSILLASAASRMAVAQETEGLSSPLDREATSFIALNSRLERSDNIRRADTGKQSDTMASLGAALNYSYTGSRITGTAVGDLGYVEYLDNTYDSRIAGNFDGRLLWGTSADLLQWEVQDVFGQTKTSALAAATPDNLQNVNVLSTGPTINLNFGETRVSLDGRYADQSYESGNLDSNRLTGVVAVVRGLSDRSSVSLNAQVDSVKYDASIADYDTRQYFVRYQGELGRTRISSDLGYTETEIDGQDPSGGSLIRVNIDRRISASSSLFLSGTTQFTSSADSLHLDRTTVSRTDSEVPLLASDPFRQREARAGWRMNRSRTSLTVSGSYSEERYEVSTPLNRDLTGVEVQLGRHIAPTLWLRTEASYQKEKFINLGSDSTDLVLSVELNKGLGRRVSGSIRYEYNNRSGNGGVADYRENRISLYLDFLAAGRR
jgi:hypothetical protein